MTSTPAARCRIVEGTSDGTLTLRFEGDLVLDSVAEIQGQLVGRSPDRDVVVDLAACERTDDSDTVAVLSSLGCVSLDIHLPDQDGAESIAEARELGVSMATLMLTGQGDDGLVVAVRKPAPATSIRVLIDRWRNGWSVLEGAVVEARLIIA